MFVDCVIRAFPILAIQQDSREVAALISARLETELCAPPLEVSPTACRQCVAPGLRPGEVPTVFGTLLYVRIVN